MFFITELINNLKENILLSSVVCLFFLGSVGIGGYYFFTRSSDNIVRKENEDVQEMDVQEEDEENIEEIKPTFLLDYSKTTFGFQIIFELLLFCLFDWFYFGKTKIVNKEYLELFDSTDFLRAQKMIFFRWFGYSFVIYLIIYLIIHSIINFILPLIAQLTSEHGYFSLLKNYWKKHFNNLGGCLIFTFSLILLPILFMIIETCFYFYKKKTQNYLNKNNLQSSKIQGDQNLNDKLLADI